MRLDLSLSLAPWPPRDAPPIEHVAVCSASIVSFAVGTGQHDPHAEAYFDAALPAAWLAGFTAGLSPDEAPPTLLPAVAAPALLRAWSAGRAALLSHDDDPERMLLAGAASLRAHVLREADVHRRGDVDPLSLRLGATRVDVAVLSFAGEALRYAMIGDVALFRVRDGAIERFGRGGTFAEDEENRRAAGLPSDPDFPDGFLDMMADTQSGCIAGVDGKVMGHVRTGRMHVAPGDRLGVTSRALHRCPDVPSTRLAAAMLEGATALDALCAAVAGLATTRSPPSTLLVRIE